jgi:hypothetical protein
MKNNSDELTLTVQLQENKNNKTDYSKKDETIRKSSLQYEMKQQKSIQQFLKNSFLK